MTSNERESVVAVHISGNPDGRPLVLSSSLGTTSRMWEPQLDLLEPEHLVIRYDHRGHGGSPAPQGGYRLADLGNDVLEILDSNGIDRVDFAGLSLGGMVGMWLGENAPDRVGRLALLCTYAEAESPEVWGERADSVRRHGTRSLVAASTDRWFTAAFRRENRKQLEEFESDLVEVADEGYAGCCEAIQTMDIASGLKRVSAPTLVVAGTQDVAAPPVRMRALAESIPDARYEEVDAAHLANVEKPTEVGELLTRHFG